MNYRAALTNLFLTAAAAILTVSTVILAPLPLMLLRRNKGRGSFAVGAVIACSILFWFTSPVTVGAFLVAVLLTAVFSECENQNIGYSSAVFVSLMVICGLGILSTGYAVEHFGFEPIEFFRSQVYGAVSQLTLPAGVTVDRDALLNQVPSGIVILIVFTIWLNSILVGRLEKLLGWKAPGQTHIFKSKELRKWKLPDATVWLALSSVAGSFFDIQPVWMHWVATNTFNVVVMLYFFQGLAIVVDLFAIKKVAPFWRTIAYLFIFSQLFLMVAFLGFVDLWLTFRDRAKPKESTIA